MTIEGLSNIQIVVRNRAGAAVSGLTVTILSMLADGSDGTAPTVYDSQGVAITGPITTDADGQFSIWVAGGQYNIRATDGTTSASWTGYRAGTAGARDVGTTAGRILDVGPNGIPAITGAQVGDVLSIGAGGVLVWSEPTGGGGGDDPSGGSFDPDAMPIAETMPNGEFIATNSTPRRFSSAKLRIESTITGTAGPLTIYGIELRPVAGEEFPFYSDTVMTSTGVSGLDFMTSGLPVEGDDVAIGYNAGPWEIEIENIDTTDLVEIAFRVPSIPQGDLEPMPGRVILSIYDPVALDYVDVWTRTITLSDYTLARNTWKAFPIAGASSAVRVPVDVVRQGIAADVTPAVIEQVEGMGPALVSAGLSGLPDQAATPAAKFIMDLGPLVPPARYWRIRIAKIVGGVDVAGAPAQSLRIWGLQLRETAGEDFNLPQGTTFESNLTNIANALENWGSTSNLAMNSTVLPIEAYISITYPEPMEFEEITFLVFQTGYSFQPGQFLIESSVDGWDWNTVQTYNKTEDDYPGGEFTSFPVPKSESIVAKVPAVDIRGSYAMVNIEFSARELNSNDAGAIIVVNPTGNVNFTITPEFATSVVDGTHVTLFNFSATDSVGFVSEAGSGIELNGSSTAPVTISGQYKAIKLVKFSDFVFLAISGV